MALIGSDTYTPPVWLPNGHFQTMFPALFRKVPDVTYRRERLVTPDGDFLNLDWAFAEPGARDERSEGAPLVILSHGFEGDSTRQYMRGMVRLLTRRGFDCLAWNYRSCGGEMNLQPRFYHSGATDDLHQLVIHAVEKGYRAVYLAGFSLGGNLTLKYLGERGEASLPAAVKKAVVFCVPMDLLACSRNLELPVNRVYQQRFLRSLKTKIERKGALYPHLIDVGRYKEVKTIYDFDNLFTAPLHGFDHADDYYRQCSARHYLSGIPVPTLVVAAANDPMIPVRSIPVEAIAALPLVQLLLTRHGGHCGYRQADIHEDVYWSEQAALTFFKRVAL